MPRRWTPLVTGEYYHVYNRGVNSQPTFSDKRDYERFLLSLWYYRFSEVPCRLSKLLQRDKSERDRLVQTMEKSGNLNVNLIAYVLMPNHFHLLLRQEIDIGISRFLSLLANSYAKYFNTRHERVGPLFQGMFKVVLVSSDSQLMHLSRYIHLNPVVSSVVKEEHFLEYPWSSLGAYVGEKIDIRVDPAPVMEMFKSKPDYLQFVTDRIDYGRELARIKHLIEE